MRILVNKIAEAKSTEKTRRKLQLAGLTDLVKLEDFIGLKLIFGFGLSLALLKVVAGYGFLGLILLAGTFFLGYWLPEFVIGAKARERQKLIKSALLDAMDLLAVTVEAGLSLDRGLYLYCQYFSGPLADEIKNTLAEIEIGESRRLAISRLAKRNDLRDLQLFVSGVIQAEKLGTPLVKALHVQVKAGRERHRRWVKEEAKKASIKMLFPVAGLILPALFAVFIGPVFIKIMVGG